MPRLSALEEDVEKILNEYSRTENLEAYKIWKKRKNLVLMAKCRTLYHLGSYQNAMGAARQLSDGADSDEEKAEVERAIVRMAIATGDEKALESVLEKAVGLSQNDVVFHKALRAIFHGNFTHAMDHLKKAVDAGDNRNKEISPPKQTCFQGAIWRSMIRSMETLTVHASGTLKIMESWLKNVEMCRARCHYWPYGQNVTFDVWRDVAHEESIKFDCEFIYSECFDFAGDLVDRYLHVRLIETDYRSVEPKEPNNDNENMQPDVHIIVLDSVSSTQARRSLPKTLKFLQNNMGGVLMHQLNRVGSNSVPNGYAFLTVSRGLLGGSADLPVEFSYHDYCYTHIDNISIVFKDYERRGYKTLYSIDWGDLWTYPDCRGFEKQAFTHDARPIVGSLEASPEFEKELLGKCIEEWALLLAYHSQFMRSYKKHPKFGLTWVTELAHNNANWLWYSDQIFEKFFRDNEKALENSFVFFMGDHGLRFGQWLDTTLGKREINNPMLVVTVPKWLRGNKELMANLNHNSVKLLTHYDVTCGTIPVTDDYCLCKYEKLKKKSSYFEPMARYVVAEINRKLESEGIAEDCEELTLNKVEDVQAYVPEKELRIYEIEFTVDPNSARYRALVQGVPDSGVFQYSGHANRLDAYGKTADCVAKKKPAMRPFCYCRD
ncbi:unnamed protein product, partial [Mesorhabditis spiculigera]